MFTLQLPCDYNTATENGKYCFKNFSGKSTSWEIFNIIQLSPPACSNQSCRYESFSCLRTSVCFWKQRVQFKQTRTHHLLLFGIKYEQGGRVVFSGEGLFAHSFTKQTMGDLKRDWYYQLPTCCWGLYTLYTYYYAG